MLHLVQHNADQAVILAKVRIMAFFMRVLEFEIYKRRLSWMITKNVIVISKKRVYNVATNNN